MPAQSPPPVAAWLGWKSVLVGIAPDSLGAHLWVRSAGTKDSRPGYFFGTFDPRTIEAWVAGARAFVSHPLEPADTGNARGSATLRSLTGDGLYIARRRKNGAWSDERFLIMESLRDRGPVTIGSDVESVRDILDSLQAVAHRAPFSEPLAQREVRETMETPIDNPAAVDPWSLPPSFPTAERYRNPNGLVVVTFVVDADGKIDMTTIRPFFSTSPPFLDAVVAALPAMRFRPAIRLGGEVRSRVLMPFQFSIVR